MADQRLVAVLPPGAVHTSWNDSRQRMAVAFSSGRIQVWDEDHGEAAGLVCSSDWQSQAASLVKVVWAPPSYGDVIACCSGDGTVWVWEETSEDGETRTWTLCASLKESLSPVLDIQFGDCASGLKLLAARADGYVQVYETTDALNLKNWQLQADFPNVCSAEWNEKVVCSAAAVSWRPGDGTAQHPVFVVGYNTTSSSFCGAKVWQFIDAHQRWDPVAELVGSDEDPEPVHHISWASNIGRPFDLVAVATRTAVSIWQLQLPPLTDGEAFVTRVSRLTDHGSDVWEAVWDMSGMTLATSGSDGVVRLWQRGFDGTWQAKGLLVDEA